MPRDKGKSEDDGWILSYVFDESQLDENGTVEPSVKSEIWVIDAREINDVVCRVKLPQWVTWELI